MLIKAVDRTIAELHEYHGHSINLDLSELQSRFRWTYFIDAKYCVQRKTALFAIDSARAEALSQAYKSIDALDAISLGAAPPDSVPV